jgi:ribonuclease G
MSKELVIGSNHHETKVAVLEDDQLVELFFQRANEYSLAGSIHKGRVTRVLPGMQSAFVDLGLERDTFLYVSDFFEEHDDIDVAEEKPVRPERRDRGDRGYGRGGEQRPFVERPAEERPNEVREIRPVPVEVITTEPSYTEGESGVTAAEVPASPATPPAEGRPQEQHPEDRGFRNDGRNRRGRRRRQRGHGFPENKYAQPASSPAPVSGPISPAPEPGGQTERVEVIILPGESLAKYRNRPAGAEASGVEESADVPRHAMASVPDELLPEPEIDPEEQQAIGAYREDLHASRQRNA